MYSAEELEALSYRELQKLAKNRKLRQSGKGITKKVLVSVLLDSVTESSECDDSLPLQELEVKLLHPVSSPEQSSFEERSFLDVERELNDSNKENTNRRRLTYEITEPKHESPLALEIQSKKASGQLQGKADEQKTTKRVRIHESPSVSGLKSPKFTTKVVKTPVPSRKSSGRPGALGRCKTPTVTQNNASEVKAASQELSVKKSALASHSKTPMAQKTPRLNKAVVLRLASSVKKTNERNRSRIPKLDVKKPPNFANIHQNAFEKMDSLWDVEHQRVLRRRNAQGSGAVFNFQGKTEPPKKMNSNVKTKKPLPSETGNAVFRFGASSGPSTKGSDCAIKKLHTKDDACKAVNKTNTRGKAMKEEQRSFLKGVRLNRRFQMQMQNRGLL
ncbi:uncharacterized protein [Hetaerina americana]|uniref:uncharacterized protein n=1 Tax=Hetaerina americana TaxID=62018 RepID=UPI003A7F4C34